MTSNDSFLVIKNSSILPARVDSMSFRTATGDDISLVSPPTLPYDIPANDSLVINVNFTPSGEQFYQRFLNIYALGNAAPITATLDGNGILPKINAYWVCDTATVPGNTSTAYLVVENPSTTADLHIYDIDFRYKTGDYSWAAGHAPKNETVPKEGKRIFDVIFSPQGAGTRADVVEISHDAAPGPEISPVADTTVDALCDGLGLTVDDSLNFNAVLLCDTYVQQLHLENTSWQSPIDVTDVIIQGKDPEYFTSDFSGNLQVPPGETRELNVTFAPDEARDYSAELVIKTSIGYDITVHLTGVGTTLYFTAEKDEFEQEPGYPITVPVHLHVIELAKKNIPELKADITFNDNMLRFDKVTFKDFAGWTWDTPVITQPGLLSISGSGNLPTEFNDKVFDIQWTVFLADVKESGINIHPLMENCTTEDTTIAKVKYSPFCFMDGRLVVTNNSNYYLMTPEPNPVSDKATVKFGLGLSGMTSITLYSTMGQVVSEIVNKEMKAGNYELELTAKDLSSGSYFLVLRSGHIVKTMQIIVTK